MSFEYEIMKAAVADAEEILTLQYAAYQSEAEIYNNGSAQPLIQTLEETIGEFKECTVLKAVCDGRIIGSVRAAEQDDGSIYIGKLMVLPGCQNKGVGKRLLQTIENRFPNKRYWLITGHKSEKNLNLYEKHGYTRFKIEEAAPGLNLICLEKQWGADLPSKVDKIHTTPMGANRIKHNLNLQTDDVVAWCKDAVKQADIIIRQGKNWYVYKSGTVITINVRSYTIITAHKINAKVRGMHESDYECLPEFLYQAIFVPRSVEPPPRSIVHEPEIFVYIKDFGTQPGDLGVVAEQNGQVIGAAWTRIIPAHGYVDSETPELAISILPEFRGYGIGTKLMKKLLKVLRENGYKQTSLSVQKDNPAVRLYQRLGYEMSGASLDHAGHEDYLMIKRL
ncbi:MAG: GNAT family N-acetyltransferase [Firmicutes bacterium]|nr:GNAT family N-acetyltransferase [Bacillota bacterium]